MPPLHGGCNIRHEFGGNRLLGFENRVAMTNRTGHSPTAESNEQLYLFFEYFLKEGKALEPRRRHQP